MNIIELNNITKKYGDKTIFKDFSLSISQGEMIAITGESGSGKTTLLNIIGLLEPIDSGVIVVKNHKNIKPNSKASEVMLRNSISYLFQNFALIEDESVQYNLMLALYYVKETKKRKEQIISSALKAVGLESYEEKKIYRLSGGEQQRVAIARSMIKPGNIVLADEPTGSVDPGNRKIIVELLKKMNQDGKTIVIVTHDPYVAQSCNRQVDLLLLNTFQ